MKGSYGRDSILYLAYWLAKEYERDESVVKQILSYCNDKIEPSCVFTIENVFSKNEGIIINCINEMAEYHLKNSKSVDLTYPFHTNHWIYFPVEILALLRIRDVRYFDNSFISNPLIDAFLPFYQQKINLNDYVSQLFEKIFR
jgi:hypothetical protein